MGKLFLTALRSYVLTFFLLCFLFAGCEKEVNDQLTGKWQLKTVEEAGNVISVDTVWYNFQSQSLFMYQLYHPETDEFSLTYGYRLQLESHIIQLELINWTITVADFLPRTDWKEPIRIFTIEKINHKQLVLKGDDKTYTFNRY
jgi:hypothetical protein